MIAIFIRKDGRGEAYRLQSLMKELFSYDQIYELEHDERYERGINKRVTIDQVRKARYKLGISKRQGRGKCQINERSRENE